MRDFRRMKFFMEKFEGENKKRRERDSLPRGCGMTISTLSLFPPLCRHSDRSDSEGRNLDDVFVILTNKFLE